MSITITNDLQKILPKFNIIAYQMDVRLESSEVTEEIIKTFEAKISEEYSLAEVLNIPLIKAARDGYKALGKDPSRYRLACESLLRRIVKGNSLYRINNIVDVGNLLSIELFRSTAILDLNKIKGDIKIRIGNDNDEYYGIGRGLINVTNIPLYCDEVSPFGSPTSDTERTMVTEDTKSILLMIICFDGELNNNEREIALDMFKTYAYAKNIKEIKVMKEEN
jgi:DNA/RNA-binding domain of Phe-tRNA-synthetase-like protein